MPTIRYGSGPNGDLVYVEWDDGTYSQPISEGAAQEAIRNTPQSAKNRGGRTAPVTAPAPVIAPKPVAPAAPSMPAPVAGPYVPPTQPAPKVAETVPVQFVAPTAPRTTTPVTASAPVAQPGPTPQAPAPVAVTPQPQITSAPVAQAAPPATKPSGANGSIDGLRVTLPGGITKTAADDRQAWDWAHGGMPVTDVEYSAIWGAASQQSAQDHAAGLGAGHQAGQLVGESSGLSHEGPQTPGIPVPGLTPEQIAHYNQLGIVDRNGNAINQQAADTIKRELTPPPPPPPAAPVNQGPAFTAPVAPVTPTQQLPISPIQLADVTNPDVQSELAARAIASAQNIPIEQARALLQTPEYADTKRALMAQAAGGQLNQYQDAPGPIPAVPAAPGASGGAGGGGATGTVPGQIGQTRDEWETTRLGGGQYTPSAPTTPAPTPPAPTTPVPVVPPAAGGGANGGLDPAMYEYYNTAAEALKAQIAQQAAYQLYLNNKLVTVDQLAAEADKAYKEADVRLRESEQRNGLALAVAELTGIYNGQQTLAGQQQQFQQGMDVATLVGSLRGPANAFQQQNVLHGLNASGMSNAIDNITGSRFGAAFQAPQAAPVPMSLSSVAADIRAGGNLTYGGQQQQAPSGMDQAPVGGLPPRAGGLPGQQPVAGPVAQGPMGQPAAPQQNPQSLYAMTGLPDPAMLQQQQGPQAVNTQGMLNALPNPNQIVGREWNKLPGSSQQFLLSGYEAKGFSADDVQEQIRRGLPQFTAPRAAMIAA